MDHALEGHEKIKMQCNVHVKLKKNIERGMIVQGNKSMEHDFTREIKEPNP